MRAVILAVEPSADLLASTLVEELKKRIDCHFSGLGGSRLKASGVAIWEDPTANSEMGVSSLSSLRVWARRIRQTRQRLLEHKPDLLVCVDSPDFNLRVAKGMRGHMHTVDYVAPQAWAWRPGRRKVVGRLFDQLLVIWPFEKDFFEGYGTQVTWVGLPALDHLQKNLELQSAPKIPQGLRAVTLLPGSRPREVKLNLPRFVEVASKLLEKFPDLIFVLPRSPGLDEELFSPVLKLKDRLIVQTGGALACLQASQMAIAVNGTVTIEAMLLGVPHITTYAVTTLQKLIYTPLMRTRFFHMANVLLNKEVVPELFDERCTVKELVAQSSLLLEGPGAQQQKQDLAQARALLGETGAAKKAAQAILRGLNGQS